MLIIEGTEYQIEVSKEAIMVNGRPRYVEVADGFTSRATNATCSGGVWWDDSSSLDCSRTAHGRGPG